MASYNLKWCDRWEGEVWLLLACCLNIYIHNPTLLRDSSSTLWASVLTNLAGSIAACSSIHAFTRWLTNHLGTALDQQIMDRRIPPQSQIRHMFTNFPRTNVYPLKQNLSAHLQAGSLILAPSPSPPVESLHWPIEYLREGLLSFAWHVRESAHMH